MFRRRIYNCLPLSGRHVGETARKPTSKPPSVSPCLRALRVNRPEASRTVLQSGPSGIVDPT